MCLPQDGIYDFCEEKDDKVSSLWAIHILESELLLYLVDKRGAFWLQVDALIAFLERKKS